jgi:hypothetical protein
MRGWDKREGPLVELLDQIAGEMLRSGERPSAERVVARFLEQDEGRRLLAAAQGSLARRTLHRAATDSLRQRALRGDRDAVEQLSLIPEDARPVGPIAVIPSENGWAYTPWVDLSVEEAETVLARAEKRAVTAAAARDRVRRFVAWMRRERATA